MKFSTGLQKIRRNCVYLSKILENFPQSNSILGTQQAYSPL